MQRLFFPTQVTILSAVFKTFPQAKQETPGRTDA
jgi:hypothetical protein